MTARRPTLDEPVVISKFWKNRRHDAVIVTLSTYEGHNLVDLRTHAMKEGRLVRWRRSMRKRNRQRPAAHAKRLRR